jgi:hypothetical protein
MAENSENNEENQIPGFAGSREQGTGQDPMDAGKGLPLKRTRPAPRLVQRVTALRGLGIARPPEPKSIRRRQTQTDIRRKDAEVPYVKVEAATRDLVCSLMERQDRMNEEIVCKINDLEYRVDDIEMDNRTVERIEK